MAKHTRWAIILAASAAVYFVLFRLGERRTDCFRSYDLYAEFLPNILYAVRSLRAGGQGLLWNPFQNCGQAFFAMSDVGLLYPANLLFLVLPPGLAVRGVIILDLVVAGTFAYLLCRALGTGT